MDLFIVKKNFQTSDSDDYDHWVDESYISFHSSNEKALTKIESLIQDELVILSKTKEMNKHINEEHWQEEEKQLKANKKSFSIGPSKWNSEKNIYFYNKETLPIFFVKKVEMD